MNGIVRPAAPEDADAVFALLTQFAVSYQPQHAAFDQHYPRLLASQDADLLVACVDGRVVGYALGFRLLTLYANGPLLELQELMVNPQHRGTGLGRALVEAMVQRARETGCAEVTVPTRRAAGFYTALGFAETAVYLKHKLGPIP
jgi:GNAT superfamily N-acetyltransferase